MSNIHQKGLACSCLISVDKSSGSGFLLNYKQTIFLVTARHVLLEEDRFISKEIEITCLAGEITDSTVRRISINLEKTILLYSKTSDVVIIKIGVIKKKKSPGVWTVTYSEGVETIENSVNNPIFIESKSIKTIDDVIISNDIFLFGYPTSLGLSTINLFDKSRPLLRKGIVANINKKTNTIILDCAVYPGNSGGPVIQSIITNNKPRNYLIGVVSKFIPYEQVWYNARDRIRNSELFNSGYSIATSMDEVITLMDQLNNTPEK